MDTIAIATATPTEYRLVRDQLRSEGLWDVAGNPATEGRSARRATEILAQLRDRYPHGYLR